MDELHGRSGYTEAGMIPLTYTTIRDWAALTGRYPRAVEVLALLRLDDVMLNPAGR